MSQTAEIIQFKTEHRVEDSDSNERNIASGYLYLHRSLQDSSFSNKAEYLATWVHLLMRATHKPIKTMLGKKSITLKVGQFISGRIALAQTVGISEQSMRTILSYFEQEQMISKSSNRNGTLFTILNFSEFQGKKINQHLTNKNNHQSNQPETMDIEASSDITTNKSTNTKLPKSTTKQENKNINNKTLVGKADANPVCTEVIAYLNEKAGKSFKNTPANHKFINGRIKDGHTLEDLKAVIDHKSIEWGNSKMFAYLRPQTLFSATNFEGYLSVVGANTLSVNCSVPAPRQSDSQSNRAKITAAIMDIGDTNW
jgi:uncharacterized phage protein (TIGR02220 family)